MSGVLGCRILLLVDRDYDVVVTEDIVALCPGLHTLIINAVLSFDPFGECWEEVCVEEVDTVNGDLEFVVQVPGAL